jgi:hypothetical protein
VRADTAPIAHLFELANKMAMSSPEYMTVQKIYAGWSFFGIVACGRLRT